MAVFAGAFSAAIRASSVSRCEFLCLRSVPSLFFIASLNLPFVFSLRMLPLPGMDEEAGGGDFFDEKKVLIVAHFSLENKVVIPRLRSKRVPGRLRGKVELQP